MKLSSIRLSVHLFHHSAAALQCGGFAAVDPAARRYQLIAVWPVLSSNCEQCHVVSWRRQLNANLLLLYFFGLHIYQESKSYVSGKTACILNVRKCMFNGLTCKIEELGELETDTHAADSI